MSSGRQSFSSQFFVRVFSRPFVSNVPICASLDIRSSHSFRSPKTDAMISRSQNQHNVGKRNRSENSETMSQKTTTGLSEPLKTLGPDVVLGSKSVGQVDANPSSTATLDQQRQTEPV